MSRTNHMLKNPHLSRTTDPRTSVWAGEKAEDRRRGLYPRKIFPWVMGIAKDNVPRSYHEFYVEMVRQGYKQSDDNVHHTCLLLNQVKDKNGRTFLRATGTLGKGRYEDPAEQFAWDPAFVEEPRMYQETIPPPRERVAIVRLTRTEIEEMLGGTLPISAEVKLEEALKPHKKKK